MKVRLPAATLLIFVIFGITTASPAAQPEGEADPRLVAAVERLLETAEDAAPQAEMETAELFGHWGVVRRMSFNIFIEMRDAPLGDGDLKHYWNQFGQHGPIMDLLLMYALEDVVTPTLSRIWNRREEWTASRKQRYRYRIAFSEIQVRTFLRQPESLRRYAHLILWDRLYLSRGLEGGAYMVLRRTLQLRDWIHSGEPDKYWWAAREFLVLAQSTGRTDLLEDADPEQLHDRFDEWLSRFAMSHAFLGPAEDRPGWQVLDSPPAEYFRTGDVAYPAVPDAPLPDWPEDVAPPPIEVLRGF